MVERANCRKTQSFAVGADRGKWLAGGLGWGTVLYGKWDVLHGADDSTGCLTSEPLNNQLTTFAALTGPASLDYSELETRFQISFLPYTGPQNVARDLEQETGPVVAMTPLACLCFNVRSSRTKNFPPRGS